jgi:hypothetical protein
VLIVMNKGVLHIASNKANSNDINENSYPLLGTIPGTHSYSILHMRTHAEEYVHGRLGRLLEVGTEACLDHYLFCLSLIYFVWGGGTMILIQGFVLA